MSSCGHLHVPSDAHAPHEGIRTIEHLVEHLAELADPSMVIVGIGNDLRGDDGIGPTLARTLAGKLPWEVIDAQTVPESFLVRIVRRRPASLLLLDAMDMGADPGTVDLLEAGRIGGQGPSTHGPAPVAFLELMGMMHPCRAAVLAIQPKQTAPGEPISEPVARAADFIAHAFQKLASQVKKDPAQG